MPASPCMPLLGQHYSRHYLRTSRSQYVPESLLPNLLFEEGGPAGNWHWQLTETTICETLKWCQISRFTPSSRSAKNAYNVLHPHTSTSTLVVQIQKVWNFTVHFQTSRLPRNLAALTTYIISHFIANGISSISLNVIHF
jgi:hypothetical protein